MDLPCARNDHEVAVLVRTQAEARTLSPLTRGGRRRPHKAPKLLPASAPVALPGVAILFHGKEIGRTDENGVAHLAMRFDSGTKVELVLDSKTASPLRLAPADPVVAIEVRDEDEIVVFDQRFIEEKPVPVKVKKRYKAPPPEPEQHSITIYRSDKRGPPPMVDVQGAAPTKKKPR